MIKAVLFDVVGTTVVEDRGNIIHDCFQGAFDEVGIRVTDDEIKSIRGNDKQQAIADLLAAHQADVRSARNVLKMFEDIFRQNLHHFHQREGFDLVMNFLRKKNIMVGIGTGLPEDVFAILFHHLQWHRNAFDYVGISEKVGAGRPDPAMVNQMLKTFQLFPHQLLKVGDTVSDIQEGKNAGVVTAALNGGTQSRDVLLQCGPDYLIENIADVCKLV